MKLIAFDCSTDTLALGVFSSGKKVAGECTSSGRHSATLAPAIERALKKSKLDLNDLDIIALGIGPGSFTGLRVAVVTAKALSYASKKKIIGVPSLEAIAQASDEKSRAIAVIADARKGLIYFALYRRGSKGLQALKKPALVSAEKFFYQFKGQAHFVGGVEMFKPKLAELGKKRAGITWDERDSYPSAEGVAEGAMQRAHAGKYDDAFRLEPLYLHGRDCNVTRK